MLVDCGVIVWARERHRHGLKTESSGARLEAWEALKLRPLMWKKEHAPKEWILI